MILGTANQIGPHEVSLEAGLIEGVGKNRSGFNSDVRAMIDLDRWI